MLSHIAYYVWGYAMKSKESTRLSVDLLPDFHEEVKDMAKTRAQTLKNYVIDALTERFQKDIGKKKTGCGMNWPRMLERKVLPVLRNQRNSWIV